MPAETALSLTIPPGPLPDAGADAARAYASVPRTGAELKPRRSDGAEKWNVREMRRGPSGLMARGFRLRCGSGGDGFLGSSRTGVICRCRCAGAAEGETIAFDVAFSNPDDLKALKGAKP